jgi:hypothetical protein
MVTLNLVRDSNARLRELGPGLVALFGMLRHTICSGVVFLPIHPFYPSVVYRAILSSE